VHVTGAFSTGRANIHAVQIPLYIYIKGKVVVVAVCVCVARQPASNAG
jgi:hypothetical protein